MELLFHLLPSVLDDLLPFFKRKDVIAVNRDIDANVGWGNLQGGLGVGLDDNLAETERHHQYIIGEFTLDQWYLMKQFFPEVGIFLNVLLGYGQCRIFRSTGVDSYEDVPFAALDTVERQ